MKIPTLIRAALVLAALTTVSCATAQPQIPETIGTLSAGPSTYTQPVHATTDLAGRESVSLGSDSHGALRVGGL